MGSDERWGRWFERKLMIPDLSTGAHRPCPACRLRCPPLRYEFAVTLYGSDLRDAVWECPEHGVFKSVKLVCYRCEKRVDAVELDGEVELPDRWIIGQSGHEECGQHQVQNTTIGDLLASKLANRRTRDEKKEGRKVQAADAASHARFAVDAQGSEKSGR